jgi:hypothetical protein
MTVSRCTRALLAVLLGNLLYFAMMPKLPTALQHAPWRLDLGLLLDFCICVAAVVLLALTERRSR